MYIHIFQLCNGISCLIPRDSETSRTPLGSRMCFFLILSTREHLFSDLCNSDNQGEPSDSPPLQSRFYLKLHPDAVYFVG